MNLIPPQRHLFTIPDEIAYFNCAYYSPQLNNSRLRLIDGVNAKSHPWHKTPASFFEDAEIIRQLASGIFGGDADGWAINPSVSYGMSLAARAIESSLKKADRILLIAEEFPSIVLAMKRAAHETGAEISTVSAPANGNWTKAILEKLDKSIRVVAVSSCRWTDGAYLDLVAIGKACRDIGSFFIIDATQSLGALPIAINEVKPDFLAASCYKWLLGPYGLSLLYVSEKWRNFRPLEETWQARENAEDFAGLVNYSDKYMPGSRRFDVGEKGQPTLLPGAIAALEQIKKWGVEEIAYTLSSINKQLGARLETLGFQLPNDSQRSPHMLGALLPEHYKGNLVDELKAKNIYISQRGNDLRFSPHLYNNEYDINRLLVALNELIN